MSEDNNDFILRDDDGVYQPQQPPAFEKVWLMIQETSKMMKEQARETDKMWRETDKKWRETDKRFEETARLISELREEYKDRWGELVESLVAGNLMRILKERNFSVEKIRQRVRNYKGEPNYELDLVASNGEEVVVVEVKSSLNVEAVKHFISQLELVRSSSRRFRKQRMVGAVAFLKDHCDASRMAMNRGLLVIRATGDSAAIINDEDFVPKRF